MFRLNKEKITIMKTRTSDKKIIKFNVHFLFKEVFKINEKIIKS